MHSTSPAITGRKHLRARVRTGTRANPATAMSDDHATSSTQTFKEQAGGSMMEFYTLSKTVYLSPAV